MRRIRPRRLPGASRRIYDARIVGDRRLSPPVDPMAWKTSQERYPHVSISIPRLMIASPAGSCGKTTIALGIISALVAQGRSIAPFEVGPGYQDSPYQELATGRIPIGIDPWLTPEPALRYLFSHFSTGADVAIIEGASGLYDGIGSTPACSSAEVAQTLGTPVVLVVDARGMVASVAAQVRGFRDFSRETDIAGVIFNRVPDEGRYRLLRDAVKRYTGITSYGWLPFRPELGVGSRQAGPLAANRRDGAERLVANLGETVSATIDVDSLALLAQTARPMGVPSSKEALGVDLDAEPSVSCRIGLAHDEAFSHRCTDSLWVLERLGAQLVECSPLGDHGLPDGLDGLILGGGCPERHAARLEANASMRAAILRAAGQGMPIYAEGGGYRYLGLSLPDEAGVAHAMCGVFPRTGTVAGADAPRGYVEMRLQRHTILGARGTAIHAYEPGCDPARDDGDAALVTMADGTASWTGADLVESVFGSTAHLHFAGDLALAENLIGACRLHHIAMRNATRANHATHDVRTPQADGPSDDDVGEGDVPLPGV